MRNRDNPYCCGAGGGLLFADKEEEPGSRISDVRFKQLQDDRRLDRRHGLSVLFDHAEGRAGERAGGSSADDPHDLVSDIQFVDLMTFVNGRMTKAVSDAPEWRSSASKRRSRPG